jgi:hypothetical protein
LVNKQTVDRTLCGTGAAAVRLMPIFASAFRGRTASECSLIAETKSPVQTRPFGGGGGLSDMQVWPSAARRATGSSCTTGNSSALCRSNA